MGAGKHCWHDFAYHLSEPSHVTAIGNRHLGCSQTTQDREANDFRHTVAAAEWVFIQERYGSTLNGSTQIVLTMSFTEFKIGLALIAVFLELRGKYRAEADLPNWRCASMQDRFDLRPRRDRRNTKHGDVDPNVPFGERHLHPVRRTEGGQLLQKHFCFRGQDGGFGIRLRIGRDNRINLDAIAFGA